MIYENKHAHFTPSITHHSKEEEDNFNNRVQHYIKAHHPHEDLSTLLTTLKMLAPHHRATLTQLSEALNQTTTALQQDESEAQYAHSVLNPQAMALTSMHIFFNTMMNESIFPSSEENNTLELW